MKKLLFILCLGSHVLMGQGPFGDSWKNFVMTNHVTYKNGDSYIHESFKYAGTGFLINHEGETYAVTAKHVLWIAKNKNSDFLELNNDLASWVLKPKHSSDSAAVDRLFNEDATEILQGSEASITERDWLIFSTGYVSPNLGVLEPRFDPVKNGEKVFLLECPYEDENCSMNEGTVFRKEGMDILIERKESKNKGGSSGSPVIDEEGRLIGILSSSTMAGKTLKNVTVAVSTEYLKDVFEKKRDLNKPKINYAEMLIEIAEEKGSKSAISAYKKLRKDKGNFYKYRLRDTNKNGLREVGEYFLEKNRLQDAIRFFEMNVKINRGFFGNYNNLADTYLKMGNNKKAKKAYELSIKRFNDTEQNPAFKSLKLLEE